MEAKAVTSGMTAMSRRSREHRSSKNAGTIRETSVLQLDIPSLVSKNPKVGIPCPSDASEHGEERGESPNLRRSSRASGRPSTVYLSRGVEGRANGAKVHVQGVKNISAAPSSGKVYAIVSEAWSGRASVETGEGVGVVGAEAHMANFSGATALAGFGGTPDAAGQANGRPLRGRPRGRHATPFKKIARRAKRLQEVILTEGDGARILGRRIKVFWHDEDKWFYGVVKAYNRGRRTHKIVYDDREEEWVKLHEEKFKLQVLEGEVFGEQKNVAAGIGRLIRKRSLVTTQEHLNGEIDGIEGPAMTGDVHAPTSPLRENAELWSDGECREVSWRIRNGGVNVRLEELENASAMECENVDLEDPYAIDHISISDSLVMFMRSKQSLAESTKAAAASGVSACSKVEGAGTRSITEASLSLELPLANEAEGNAEVSGVAQPFSKAGDVVLDRVSSEECIIEEGGGAGGTSCGDGKSPSNFEAAGNAMGVDVDDPSNHCGRPNVLEVLGDSTVGGLHTSGYVNGECGVGDCAELSDSDLSGVEVVACISSEEGHEGLGSGENDSGNVGDGCSEESGNRAAECTVGREVCPCWGEMRWARNGPAESVGSESNSVARRPVGGSPRDRRQVQSLWLVRPERFISWSIGTNLVEIDCAIPWQQVAVWILGVDNVWRCVPYLTLFVDVILEGDRSEGDTCVACTRRCYGEQSAKGASLRRSVLSALFSRSRGSPGLACPFSRLGSARIVLHGTRALLDGSKSEVGLRQGDNPEGVEVLVEANPGCCESLCVSADGMFAEPILVKELVSVPAVPVLDVVDSGGEKLEQETDVVVDDVSFPRNIKADASESYAAAPSPRSAEDDAVCDSTIVAVGAGSGGGLTEVLIGSAVEGEDESGLACYRSWKSVKRAFSQIAPEYLGSDGLGSGRMLQELLESELGRMSLTKRQKIHVESLGSRGWGDGTDEGEKEMSPRENGTYEDMKSMSVDAGDCDSAVPRVNVLKLRKCSTGKGGWRVAGNSCHAADRSAMQCGDGGEPLTPSSVGNRKRSFSELNLVESPEESGHALIGGTHVNGNNVSNAEGPDEMKVKVKGMWLNCGVSSIQDVPYNPRKRFKHGSSNSGSSNDSCVPELRADEAYPSRNRSVHVYAESVCQGCMANVLVVQHDRGWREHGATVGLQSCHEQGWMLMISVRGENMYAYKAEQAMATGNMNRHRHAIVWKGGKGWSLEFEEKKHWQAFKELHEECYRRNGKTSSVRQIPIPGVRHIEDMAPRSPGCHFVRPHSRYICRTEEEVEVALGNSRVVYDMDSEDEQWLAQINTERASARGTRMRPLIAEETLERLMDKLEKDAYLHQQQKGVELGPKDVVAESCMGMATQEVIKVVYGYWVEKRTRKGMPLVRHFQPPAWEQYQRQVKLWEQEIAALQLQQPSASMQQLTEEVRKPPLFAFCLRPRGLEVQHKLSKQKSHRKQPWPGNAPRAWVNLDGSVDRRQYYTEPGNGPPPGPRRPGRPRLSEIAGANLTGTFNAIVRTIPVLAGATGSTEYRNSSLNDYAQRRAGKGKKIGRKARRQRLLAAAQESRRKRLLLRDIGSVELEQEPDLALAAARARNIAEATRARAQALYAVADAAMHKAVAAVIAADALRAVECLEVAEERATAAEGVMAAGPICGSWRRGDAGSGMKGFGGGHGVESDGEDALLPVASWSQELGAGLGTRLLNKGAAKEGMMSSRSVHVDSPLDVGLGRGRGECMVAMLSG